MDEGRKRVIGIMAHADGDLFGTPIGSPQADKPISASIHWAEKIMERIGDYADEDG